MFTHSVEIINRNHWRSLKMEIYGHLERSSLLQNGQKGSQRVWRNQRPVVNRQDHFEELQKGKEKSSHRIYRLQENVRDGAHSWLKETLKTVRVADNICRLLGQNMCN